MDASIKNNGGSKNFSPFKFFVIFFIFLVLLNLAYIDILTFLGKKSDVAQITPVAQKPLQKENDICPQSCVSQIQEATASYKPTFQTLTITPIEAKSFSPRVKEFFISFGSGSNSSSDWKDVEGLQTYIDSANYEGLKSVAFEASVHVPTGNQTASVRLFNATDKHPVWFSEVLFNGGGSPQLLISKPITLDEGNKLYKVQMKTQLQFQAILDQARIHIIIN
jgi:hypothetical protein